MENFEINFKLQRNSFKIKWKEKNLGKISKKSLSSLDVFCYGKSCIIKYFNSPSPKILNCKKLSKMTKAKNKQSSIKPKSFLTSINV